MKLISLNMLSFAAIILFAGAISRVSAQTGAAKENPIATIETSLGKFEIELYPADAPKTVENFIGLADKKYFDGMRVHRVVRNFVIQAGDPNSKDLKKRDAWGTGGTSIWNKEFEDELNPNTQSFKDGYLKGVVAMANRGPNTNTSQFFVMLANNLSLPKNYAIFGKVVKGLDVVDKIGAVDVEPNSQPKVDVIVKKVRISHSTETLKKK